MERCSGVFFGEAGFPNADTISLTREAVCRFLAQKINEHLVSHLGAPGMVLMAAHHSLLTNQPVVRVKRRDAEVVVNEYLCGRY
jgi:hypothetical protein